jgi:hypothetical protein
MKKLIYADTFSVGAFHETFNASSLKMFSEIYSEIIYRAAKDSKKTVEDLLGKLPSNVEYKPLRILSGSGRTGSFFRYLSSALWNIFIALSQSHDEVLYLNYNSLWANGIINCIVKYRKTHVIISCHGELEYIQSKTKLNAPAQAGLNLLTNSRWKISDGLYFCVLGKSILNNIHKIVAAEHLDKFISYEHSFIPHQIKEIERNDKILRVGTIGATREYKGLNHILAIGEALKGNPNIKFYTLGVVTCNPQLLTQANINYIPSAEKGYVHRDLLNSYIDQMDCLIYAYPTNKYKFMASGALFDAIDREKIILSLHNDYFDGIFCRAMIGKQFDSLEQMIEYLKKGKIRELNTIDFKANKHILSPKCVAKEFKEILINASLI